MSNRTTRTPVSSTRPPTISLDEIIRHEPRVDEVLRWARSVHDVRDEHDVVCKNALLPTYARPLIAGLVGWHRQPCEVMDYLFEVAWAEGIRTPRFYPRTMSVHAREAERIRQGAIHFPKPDPVLASSVAYDIVFKAVYHALPRCRNCACQAMDAFLAAHRVALMAPRRA